MLTSLLLHLLAIAIVVVGDRHQLIADLDQCMQHDLTKSLLICDIDHLLSDNTTTHLNSLLNNLRTIECQCVNRELCFSRAADGIDAAYTGILFVTRSEKIGDDQLNATAEELYLRAGLRRENCNNGLLIVYVQDTREMVTYRGPMTHGLLTEDDVEMYEAAALWSNETDDESALEFVIEGYQTKLDQTIKAETWAPIIGLTAAVVVCVVVAVLILVLACCCCCTRTRHKSSSSRIIDDQLYPHVHGSYTKAVDPVYIVTDGGSERPTSVTPAGGDGIYSTPTYAGTPQLARHTPDRYVPTSGNYPPYLDPMRPKETQTKEHYLD